MSFLNISPRIRVSLAHFLSPFLLALASPAWSDATSRDLTLSVWLGDREIGQHAVSIQSDGETTQAETNVTYHVKILFVSVFKYTHTSRETWSGNCLIQIQSATLDNGDRSRMQGRAHSDGFQVTQAAGVVTEANPCVGTYAYWDKQLIQRDALLNTQTGQLHPATVAYVGKHPIPRLELNADAYQIDADDSAITVWYSDAGEWLALETVANDQPLVYLNDTLL